MFRVTSAELTSAGRAANHQHPHRKKAWKFFSNKIDDSAKSSAHAFDQILSDEENWLDGANISGTVLEQRVMIFKIVRQRLVDQLVITVIFAFVLKRAFPHFQVSDARKRQDPGRSSSERSDNVTAHFRHGTNPSDWRIASPRRRSALLARPREYAGPLSGTSF